MSEEMRLTRNLGRARWLVLVLAISLSIPTLILAFSAGTSASNGSPFAGGSGTVDDPYQIASAEQLQAMKDYLDSHFILINDIDASDTVNWNDGKGFEPIGYTFTGSFDGQEYKVIGLYINRPDEVGVGLFSSIGGGVENIRLENINVTGGGRVGGLVGHNGGMVLESYSTGSVTRAGTASIGYTNRESAGGLVGYNIGGTVSESYSASSVTATGIAGGLVGYNWGTVSNSYSTGSVTADGASGGLVGMNDGAISKSYSTGSVTGSGWAGGLVGYKWVNNPSVSKSFWDTQTSGQSRSDGGSGKTTSQMKTRETFTNAGWDFEDTWGMDGVTNDGYPFLLTFASPVVAWELTTSIDPLGAGSVSPSSGFFVDGEEVTLTASPDSGYEFSHWSGGASENSTQVTVTMDGDKHVVANFVEEEPEAEPSGTPEPSGQEEPDGGFPWLVIFLIVLALLLILGSAFYSRRRKSKSKSNHNQQPP